MSETPNVDPSSNKAGMVVTEQGVPVDTPDTQVANALAGAASPEREVSHWAASHIQNKDLLGHPFIQNTKSLEDLAEQGVNAQKLVGADKVLMPRDNWGESEWNEWDSRMGVPENGESYLYAGSDQKPEDFEGSPVQKILNAAKEHHIPAEMMRNLVRSVTEIDASESSAASMNQEESLANAESTLRKEFGASYDKKLELANRAVLESAGNEMEEFRQLKLADGTYAGDNPLLVRMFSRIGEFYSEDTFVGEKSQKRFSMTPDEARDRYEKLSRTEARFDSNHPEHNATVRELDSLSKFVYPEGSPG